MKYLSLALGTFFLAVSLQAAVSTKEQHVVVHLKHFTDDLHAAKMALKLAGGMRTKGAKVTLLLSLEGARLVDKNQPLTITWGSGKKGNLAQLYSAFVDAGGEVMVCPHCAASAGCQLKDLRKGARFAGKGKMADLILEADKVLSY